MQKFAVRVLSQPCSASGCERNWFVFERIHTKKRNRLEQKRLNDLVFVQYNLRLRPNQLLNKRPDTDPIVLDDVDPTSDWVVETEETELDVDFDLEVEALVADESHDAAADVDPLLASAHGVDPDPDMPGSSRPPASGSRRKGKRLAVEDDLEDSDSQPEIMMPLPVLHLLVLLLRVLAVVLSLMMIMISDHCLLFCCSL